MKNSTKLSVAAAATTGLLLGISARAAQYIPTGDQSQKQTISKVSTDAGIKALLLDDSKDKHDCAGKNDCKGKGGCKTGDGGCKGKNTCKGKGGCATNKDKVAAATSIAGVTAMLLDDSKDKHDCAGKNDCKGKGGCKTGDGGCKGKNTCKGKGGCATNKDSK